MEAAATDERLYPGGPVFDYQSDASKRNDIRFATNDIYSETTAMGTVQPR